MPLYFDIELEVEHITIPPISDDVYHYFETMPENIKVKLVSILKSRPDSDVQVFKTEFATFATWTKIASKRSIVNWEKEYGHLRRDLGHDTSWAIIAAKLISITQHFLKTDRVFTEYSAQFLLDFAVPRKRRQAKERRVCCQPRTVVKGLEYALKNNIPKEKDWKYVGCRDESCKPLDVLCYPVKGEIHNPKTIETAMIYLQHQPVAARLHIFEPDCSFAKDEIYRGPKYMRSQYNGQKDVIIYATKIVDKELVAVVKFPCGNVEYLNVSLDVMLVHTPTESDKHHEELAKPSGLLTEFCLLLPPPP